MTDSSCYATLFDNHHLGRSRNVAIYTIQSLLRLRHVWSVHQHFIPRLLCHNKEQGFVNYHQFSGVISY
ncbi:unnamed protein product [Absidia cylindrospora]